MTSPGGSGEAYSHSEDRRRRPAELSPSSILRTTLASGATSILGLLGVVGALVMWWGDYREKELTHESRQDQGIVRLEEQGRSRDRQLEDLRRILQGLSEGPRGR